MIRNTVGAVIGPNYAKGQGAYCGLSTDSTVFLIFTTRQYQLFRAFFRLMLVFEEPEVFLKYSQPAILHAAYYPEGSKYY